MDMTKTSTASPTPETIIEDSIQAWITLVIHIVVEESSRQTSR